MKKKAKKKIGKRNYKHIGRGMNLADGGEYPCDHSYEHIKTGKMFTVYSTRELYHKMPRRVRGISQLRKMEGVKVYE